MHNSRENEGGQHIREVSDQSENGLERGDQQRNDGHGTNLNNTKNDDLIGLNEEFTALNLILLHSFINRLHPKRETTRDCDEHHDIENTAKFEGGRH